MKKILLLTMIFYVCNFAQNIEQNKKEAIEKVGRSINKTELRKMSVYHKKKSQSMEAKAQRIALENNIPMKVTKKDGSVISFRGIIDGKPVFIKTYNAVSAITSNVDRLHTNGSLGLNLNGEGCYIGLWDEGLPLHLHQSFVEGQYGPYHVIIEDSTGETADHATHVAGTMVADGDYGPATGMAPKAVVKAWDSKYDISEISYAVLHQNPEYMTISNHSYGSIAGWEKGLRNDTSNWYWMGTEIAGLDDPAFGSYKMDVSGSLDSIAMFSEYYLMVRAAGNDRGKGPGEAVQHYYWDDATSSYKTSSNYHPDDGGLLGFDCLPPDATAKNIMTVGACDDIVNRYNDTSDVKQTNTHFSVWGPTDDGRIKPDIVANGDNLTSTLSGSVDDYGGMSGTSQAAPSVTSTLALLQQHYKNTHNQEFPKASTLKALVIHSANEAGDSPGPDYKFGWGLLNAEAAANLISNDVNEAITISEERLLGNDTNEMTVYSDGLEPLKVSIVWIDPVPENESGPILVDDLNLRLADGQNTYYPWVLDPANPNNAATKGNNNKDNVEQVLIENPSPGAYTISVSHSYGYARNYSMIISGASSTPAELLVTVRQYLSTDNETDSVAHYENYQFKNYPSGKVYNNFPLDQNQYFRATPKVITNPLNGYKEKFNNWNNGSSYLNHHWFMIDHYDYTLNAYLERAENAYIKLGLENIVFNYDSIHFKDPWYKDLQEAHGIMSRGINAIWHAVESPFNNELYTSDYQGVFLGEGFDGTNWSEPYYSLKTESPRPISINGTNHLFYFQRWEAYPSNGATFQNANSAETPVVFNSANAEVRAVMKGTGFSDDESAISYPGQRKIVQIDNGNLYRVYSSMDQVWLESSTDGGSSWTFQVLNNGERAKNVSITRYLNTVLVAYQIEGISEYSNINIDQFRGENGVLISTESVSGVDIPVIYSSNLFPIIEASFAQLNQGTFLIAWKQSDGLYYRNGASDIYSGLWWNHDPQKVNGTTSSSSYPTMAVLKGAGYPKSYHLAYQEGTQQIRYIKINEDYQHTITFSSVETPSYGSGFSYNKYPSIIVIDNNDPRVAWMGYNLSSANKTGLNKELIPEDAHRAVLRAKSGSTWSSTFFKWDYQVLTVNINRPDNNAYLLGWVTGTTSLSNKYIENTDIYDTHTFGTLVGKNFQFSNAATKEDMLGMSFGNDTTSYAIDLEEVNMSLQKVNSSLISYAREGIITKDSTQLYFRIADIILDNEKVSFVDDEEEKYFTSIDDLNSYLESESFNLTDMANLEYSVEFGSLNTTPAVNVFANGDYVKFKVELVDVQNNEVLGTFDNIEFNKNSVDQYSRTAYQVDCDGIGNKEVKLRLVINENIGALYTAGNISADVDIIGKQNLMEVNFKGELPVKNYQLTQNYPNPFNPTTTISYAVKEAGIVTLKIYNMLGEEIRTLVNTAQQKGRYEVQFNASNLASGVYIYRLQVNDFTATKKLMLLK